MMAASVRLNLKGLGQECAVPLCKSCADHWEQPIFRSRNHTPQTVLVVLFGAWILGVFHGLHRFPPSIRRHVRCPRVVLWIASSVLRDFENRKIAEGGHALILFITARDLVFHEFVTVIDSCVIKEAVNGFAAPGGAIFGFGNKTYANEFEELNPTAEFVRRGHH
jgi:hypothetical protein